MTTLKLPKLNLIYPYYENPTMLSIQLAHWESYPAEIRKRTRIILIDDASPTRPAQSIIRKGNKHINLELYRVQENIPWNQHGCRNLGATLVNSDSEWMLMSDMDMVLDADNAAKLFAFTPNTCCWYKFGRMSMPQWEKKKYHCNTILLTKGQYWNAGGYDEDYCGSYGGDGPFHTHLGERYECVHKESIFLKYYGRGYINDSGTNEFDRDGELRQRYHDIGKEKRKNDDRWPKNPLRFQWERLV